MKWLDEGPWEPHRDFKKGIVGAPGITRHPKQGIIGALGMPQNSEKRTLGIPRDSQEGALGRTPTEHVVGIPKKNPQGCPKSLRMSQGIPERNTYTLCSPHCGFSWQFLKGASISFRKSSTACSPLCEFSLALPSCLSTWIWNA